MDVALTAGVSLYQGTCINLLGLSVVSLFVVGVARRYCCYYWLGLAVGVVGWLAGGTGAWY